MNKIYAQTETYDEFKKKWDEVYGVGLDQVQPSTSPSYGQDANADAEQEEWETVDNGGGYFTVNRVKKKSEPVTPVTVASTECNHVWRHYIGLNQVFDYCEICDLKRESK